MIEARNLTYGVPGCNLLNGVDISARAGKMLIIVGPNGAGKSTLLKLLTGDLRPTAGELTFYGKPLAHYSTRELSRRRAVLAQQNRISLPFNVQDIVMMGRYPYYDHAPSAADHDIVALCLRQAGVEHLAGRVFPTLSGGEQQRVQLARTLAQIWTAREAFLFLDEPTNGMDLKHQYHTLDTARTFSRKGFGVVAVLHDLNMALHYADELLVLSRGRVAACGSPTVVLTSEIIRDVFGIAARILHSKDLDKPLLVTQPLEPANPAPHFSESYQNH